MLSGALLRMRRLAAGSSAGGRRLDIQGLRAVAVLSVVLDHLCAWPGGGFVGVDVFFVISGFLITGILIREWERTENISWENFYVRRVKRIIPAAVITLSVTCVASWLLFTSAKAWEVCTDALWSLFFIGNWRFATAGTDYFHATDEPSPLQHFWSLGVEEQYYFVWPWFMLAALIVMAKIGVREKFDRPLVAGLLMLLCAASFLFALQQSAEHPTSAYFSTFTRAWELGAGAILATSTPLLKRLNLPVAARRFFMSCGLAGIFISFFAIDSTSQFPAPWALLPVLSTVVVIAAGTAGADVSLLPLTSRPAVFVGNISYSLYLWHFPVIILVGSQYESRAGGFYYSTLIAVMFALSIVSFYAIEKPLNAIPIGTKLRNPTQKAHAWNEWRDTYSKSMRHFGLVGLALLVAGPTALVVHSASESTPHVTEVSLPVQARDSGVKMSPEQVSIQQDLVAALNESDWPDELRTKSSEVVSSSCQDVVPRDESTCMRGTPGKPLIVVLGDSLAGSLMPTVTAAYGREYSVRGLTKPGCPINGFEIKFASYDAKDCDDFAAESIEYIKKKRPVAVFIIQNYDWAGYTPDGESVDSAAPRWEAADRQLINNIKGATQKVAFVGAQPAAQNVKECHEKKKTAGECVASLKSGSSWFKLSDVERNLAGVSYIDTLHWWCVQSRCPAFSKDIQMRWDHVHQTPAYAERVAKDFREMVDREVLKPASK